MSERPVIAWPVKTREIISHHFDSRAWNNFVFRDGDIVVATYAKSGTTWTQQNSLAADFRRGGEH